ncbi:MAG TPA: hypothetical protein VNX68_07760, partial [Nitrosopumilaceae archaeon]|nr:hypothetical protein [Nitrosopumilaceae archaeon]
MTKKYFQPALYLLLGISIFTSCVPQRKLEECETKSKACDAELSSLKTSFQADEAKLKELNEQMVQNTKEITSLKRDTNFLGVNYRQLTVKYDKLNQLNDEIMDKYNRLLAGTEKDNAKLSGDLQNTQEQLLKKQDELKALSDKLNKQQQDLD